MAETYDIAIIGAGPGGVAAGILAQKANLSYVIQERKHSNLIFTAVQDASVALSAISSLR